MAQTTRGNVTAEDVLAAADAAPDTIPRGYASGYIVNETLDTTSYGTLSYAGTLTRLPVRPYTVTVDCTVGATALQATDDGSGYLRGYDIQGTIDYTTGAVVIEFTDDPGDGAIIYVSYHQDLEAATDIPKIISKLSTKGVFAHVYALKDTIGLESSYALRRRFGAIAEDEMASDLIAAINSELMNTVVYYANANYTGTVNWDNTKPTGVSYFDHEYADDYVFAKAA